MGFYSYDEPAGRELDLNETRINVNAVTSNIDAAAQFENNMSSQLNPIKNYLSSTNFQLFTSDYALYWFDYKSGYDTVFAEFGWNYSRQLNLGLCRGAANVQNKAWGIMITWTYTRSPYIESGSQLYSDMKLAYDNGAKYIVVFDSNQDYTGGILKDEHLHALQQFWQYAQNSYGESNPVGVRVAFVLPDGYGYGFRGPNDRIWGIWSADAFSNNLSISVSNLIEKYDTKLDIIYDDGLQPGNNYGYSKLIYWNDPSLVPSPSPTPSTLQFSPQNPSQTPSPTLTESSSSLNNYIPVIAFGTVITAFGVSAVLLKKRQYFITFAQTGIEGDFAGTVVVVDGESYDRYGALFSWNSGSRHTFEFKSPIVVSRGNQYVKQYVWSSTTGLEKNKNGILTASMSDTVTGNYRPVFNMDASRPTITNNSLRSSRAA